MPIMQAPPLPSWADPSQASVMDSPWTKAIRALVQASGLTNPQSIMGAVQPMPVEGPVSGAVSGLKSVLQAGAKKVGDEFFGPAGLVQQIRGAGLSSPEVVNAGQGAIKQEAPTSFDTAKLIGTLKQRLGQIPSSKALQGLDEAAPRIPTEIGTPGFQDYMNTQFNQNRPIVQGMEDTGMFAGDRSTGTFPPGPMSLQNINNPINKPVNWPPNFPVSSNNP